MTTASIFLFKQSQIRTFIGEPDDPAAMARQMHRAAKFLCVDLPVGTQLNRSAKRQQQRKAGMTMDTSLQVRSFGPRVGIEHIVIVWPQPITCEQSPDILAVRPQEQVVAAQAVRVFRQSSGGFVDSHNQVARMSFSQGCGAVPSAAE